MSGLCQWVQTARPYFWKPSIRNTKRITSLQGTTSLQGFQRKLGDVEYWMMDKIVYETEMKVNQSFPFKNLPLLLCADRQSCLKCQTWSSLAATLLKLPIFFASWCHTWKPFFSLHLYRHMSLRGKTVTTNPVPWQRPSTDAFAMFFPFPCHWTKHLFSAEFSNIWSSWLSPPMDSHSNSNNSWK
jgi:hypothetical protein